nr:hypothetical protein [Buchnera aphidicola]
MNHFIFFWKNPIRYFCRHRLKIIETSLELQNNNVENFTLNKINNYNLCKDILNAIVYQKSINYIFQHYEKSGLLPHGEIGIAIFNNCKEKMLDIAKKILYLRKFPKTKTINVQIKNCLINGLLTQICKIGLLEWRPKILNFNDSIDLWFKHLFYCLSGGKKNSLMIGLNSSILKFENLTVESAYYYLHSYIDAYTKGMNDPLLLTKSGLIWLTTVFDKKNNIITNNNIKHLKGIKKFTDTWNGNDYFSGEKENFYIKQVIPVLTKSNITKMCDISKKWLLPILINQTTIKLPLKNLT